MTGIKKLSITIVGSAVLALGTGSATLAANLIGNGDFETVDISVPYTTYNSTTVPNGFGWSISNDFVYLVNSFWSGVSGTTNPDGFDQSLELRPDATLSQKFSTKVGHNYELSFWYAHDPDNEKGSTMGHLNVMGTDVLLSNTLVHNIPSTRADLKFLKYIAQFTANSEITTLSFQGDPSNKGHGFVIDGVSVVENLTSVPEPSSVLGLLAFGTFGVSSLLKRKQQQKVLNSVVSE